MKLFLASAVCFVAFCTSHAFPASGSSSVTGSANYSSTQPTDDITNIYGNPTEKTFRPAPSNKDEQQQKPTEAKRAPTPATTKPVTPKPSASNPKSATNSKSAAKTSTPVNPQKVAQTRKNLYREAAYASESSYPSMRDRPSMELDWNGPSNSNGYYNYPPPPPPFQCIGNGFVRCTYTGRVLRASFVNWDCGLVELYV